MTLQNSSCVDVTTLFKSCVKTIKTRNKAIGISSAQSKIFPKHPTTHVFSQAKDILENIYSHNTLLHDHRKKYLLDNDNSLSDVERIYMDKVVTKNLKFIEENIRTLETQIKEPPNQISDHAVQCHLSIISILRATYQKTFITFRDMKGLHQNKQKEKEQLFKLQRPSGMNKKVSMMDKAPYNFKKEMQEKAVDLCSKSYNKSSSLENANSTSENFEDESPKTSYSSSTYFEDEVEEILGDINDDERKLLEEENDHLYHELMSNQEEIRHITKQVVELSRMQDMLTENVDIQAQQIEDIHETILHSTDNVQRGNEQVREAMRKDAGFRVWIMFFLIVMSFSVLFLDWYNP